MSRTSEREPRGRKATIDRLAAWARSQFEAWRDAPAQTQEVLWGRLERLEAASPSIFLFDFAAGSVGLRRKTRSWPELGDAQAELLRRVRLYLALFRDVVAGFDLDCTFRLAVDVDDHPLDGSGAPLFAFQKRTGSSLILLPDIDILGADYFLPPDYDDPFTFEEKADAAVFVGATTGGDLTREVVESLGLQRLRSAVFFRGSTDVTFHLPKIVQYDTEETAEMVRALGVSGSPASWKDQFGYKYLLSMDGNGATCSRVAVALKSHSVLIKYTSDHQLFYFDGLDQGENLLSVSTDEDVYKALEWCRRRPVQASAIARAGRQFALEHLTRLPVMIYVACLLNDYGAMTMAQEAPSLNAIRGAATVLGGYAHVRDVGDAHLILGGWLGSLECGRPIEGFALEPGPGLHPLDISYQAVLADGGLSGCCFGSDFCGTRGKGLPLRGASITLGGAAARRYELRYLAAFADGSLVGPVSGGTLCRSSQDAELTGLRLMVRDREADLHPA